MCNHPIPLVGHTTVQPVSTGGCTQLQLYEEVVGEGGDESENLHPLQAVDTAHEKWSYWTFTPVGVRGDDVALCKEYS